MKKMVFATAFLFISCVPGRESSALAFSDVGNAPLNELNYSEWNGVMPVINHSSRVYHTWVNGDEHFYYQGGARALNDMLQKFAAMEVGLREVVIRPGPGKQKAFDDGNEIAYDWKLHIRGGVSKIQPEERDDDANIWNEFPVLTILIGKGNVDLERIELPEGVPVRQLGDLRTRYHKGLKSDNDEVRGYAAYYLAEVDPYNRENLSLIAILLNDGDDWVQAMAEGALRRLGTTPEQIRLLKSKHKWDREISLTTEPIEIADLDSVALMEHRTALLQISNFLSSVHDRVEN